jgi:disulfide bond formation protein DsbB
MVINLFSDRNFLCFIAGVALASLIFAYIAEYVFGVIPCPMCYYERYIYWSIVLVGVIGSLFPLIKTFAIRFLGVILIFGLVIGIYHLGIENHWWAAPAMCTGGPVASSPEEFLQNLQSRPIGRCDEVGWRILGISATIWNLIWYGLFLFLWIIQRKLQIKEI